jgi:hypothetical protein
MSGFSGFISSSESTPSGTRRPKVDVHVLPKRKFYRRDDD